MQAIKSVISDTKVSLLVTAELPDLEKMKEHVLEKMAPQVKVPGFREGKVPLNLVERHLNQSVLQQEFLEEAVNHFYPDAVNQAAIRPLGGPQISITKFVPFTVLEFVAEVEVIGDIKLPEYTKIKVPRPKVQITEKDVKEVLASLQVRMAERKEVKRAAANTDEVWIDFSGIDAEGKPVAGADGEDYPLILGSHTFIPGFEENIIGMNIEDSKSFDVTFPKDYGVKALQGKKVKFTVKLKQVKEVMEPKLDDVFAGKAGPFKTLAELKADIKKQLQQERQYQSDRDYENDVVRAVAAKTKMAVPQSLVDDQVERIVAELKQNLTYRGQTWQEYLEERGIDEAAYRAEVRPAAEERVKGGLILSEIAEKEKITVSPEELEIRLQLLKGQYKDPAMQAELDKSESQRDIVARMLTEKTLAKLLSYASS
jgi:trigger factor